MSARLAAVLWVTVLALSCSRCGGVESAATSTGVERYLPKGAVGVVVVPSLTRLGDKVKLVQALKVTAFAGQLQGFPDGKALGDALIASLGIDVRDPKALEQAGLDGNRSAGAAMLVTGNLYLALPVRDAAKLQAALETLARQRLGTTAVSEEKSGEVLVRTWLPKAGEAPRLGCVIANGYAFITDGLGVGKLAGVASMTANDSLATDKEWLTESAKLPKEHDLVVYFPNGSPALIKAPMASALATVALSPVDLIIEAHGTAKPGAIDLGALQPQAGAKDLLGYLPRDAFLVARYSGDPAKLAPLMKDLLGPNLTRAFQEGGFELEKEGLAQLNPGIVASLSLSERPPMDKGMPSFDLRETNPFTYAHLSGAASAKSADVILPALEKIATVAPRFGAHMEVKERSDGQKAVLTSYAQGEGVHFAPKGDLVFFGSPVQRLDALVRSDGKGGSPVTPLGSEALAVGIDLSRLAASVRALPESAWGLGGFAIKATTVRWLDATDDLKGISLSVGANAQRVEAKLTLSLGGGAKAAP